MTIRPDILRAALQARPGLTPAGTRDLAGTGTTHGRPDLVLLEQVLASLHDSPGTAPAAEGRLAQPGPGQPPGFLAAGGHGCPLCGCPPRMHPVRPGRAGLLVAWLADNYARPLRSADMAQAIGRSVRAMEAACRREFGMTPHQLLAGIRLQRAHLLLTGPAPRSYTEVAASVGFSRVSRFTAAYRRRYPGAPATGANPARQSATLTGADPARIRDMITAPDLSCSHAGGRADAQDQ